MRLFRGLLANNVRLFLQSIGGGFMELREAIKVLDSDAHARDFDNDIRQYLPEPYRSQKASFIPSEHYDRNLGGTLGQSGAKVEDRLAAMDLQHIDTAVMFPTSGLGVGRVRDPQFQTALCRAYNDFISDYCKASPLKAGQFASG
jgi:hypothetical protein